jgi:hypothetical protein
VPKAVFERRLFAFEGVPLLLYAFRCTNGGKAVDPIDPVIGVRNPDRFAEKIRDGKYPENNISLIQIADKYRQTISNDPTGERFLKICEFIYSAGGPNRAANVLVFTRHNMPHMPHALRDRLNPFLDNYTDKSTADVERGEFAEQQHKENEQQHIMERREFAEQQHKENEQLNAETRGFLRRLFNL